MNTTTNVVTTKVAKIKDLIRILAYGSEQFLAALNCEEIAEYGKADLTIKYFGRRLQ